jgi:lipoprotein-releasing system permease protein
MSSTYEWIIGTRHLRSTHRRGFVSFVAIVSIVGLMLGVATLITVLSVMNGFERELRSRILSVTAHGTLVGIEGSLGDWQLVQKAAQMRPGVTAAVPFIESESMVANGQRVTGAMVRGVLPEQEKKATGLAQRIMEGSLEALRAGSYETILGSALARQLHVRVGDSVVLIAPEGTATPSGVMPRMRRFHVAGLFESGMYEFDNGLALVHMSDAAKLFRLGDRVSGIRLALADPLKAPRIVRALAVGLGGGYAITDWTTDHANFFHNIEMTKTMMFLILLMIVAVAVINIVSTLVMIVKEKRTDIAILRTLGAGPRNILKVFAIQGVLIGLFGTALGAGLGILLSHNLEALVKLLERTLGTEFMDARIYYMSDLPAYVEVGDVIQVCLVAFFLCALATVYPAWRASRTAPAEALRHD